jgi:hypothetical protein
MISMKHSAITLKRPGAVHIYLPKVLMCAQVQSTQKLVNPPNPISGMPAHPSPAAGPRRINPAGRQQIASAKEIIKVPRKDDLFSSCASSGRTMER